MQIFLICLSLQPRDMQLIIVSFIINRFSCVERKNCAVLCELQTEYFLWCWTLGRSDTNMGFLETRSGTFFIQIVH